MNSFEEIFKPVNRELRVNSRVNKYDKDILVSATQTRNYALNDPCLDWLRQKLPNLQNSDFVQHLMSQGNLFEKMTLAHIMSRPEFGEVKQVVETPPSGNDLKSVKSLFSRTKQIMLEGCPVIYQGCLYSKKHNIWGIADFIIRSDYVNLLVNGSYDEVDVSARGIPSSKYHYVLFDTKWSTVNLLSDGQSVSNAKKSAVYKYQLAVYSICLEEFQKCGIQTAFVLGRRYRVREEGKYVIYDNIFEKAGRIDFHAGDSHYLENALKAVKWIRQVKTYGHTWSVLPKPSRLELYPNMKNYSDDPYRPAKEYIAEKINEITSVWYCGYFARESCFDKGIYQWTDPRCTSNEMSLTGKKISPIIDAILNVNRSEDIIQPSSLTILNSSWLVTGENTVKFFVDFEFDNSLFDSSMWDKFPKSTSQTTTYMIGVGHTNKGKWCYQNFLVDTITKVNETKIFTEFYKYISHVAKNRKVYLYHWSPAEKTRIQNLQDKTLIDKFNEFKWIDMLNEIKATPIVVNGALNFGLKTFGKALYSHGKINTCWDVIEGALDTVTKINHFNNLAVSHKKSIKQIPGHETIIQYNEVDCKVISEIFEFLYNYYIAEDDVTTTRAKRSAQSCDTPRKSRKLKINNEEEFVFTGNDEIEDEYEIEGEYQIEDDDEIEDDEYEMNAKAIQEHFDNIFKATNLDKVDLQELVELYAAVTSQRYLDLDPHTRNLVNEYIRGLYDHNPGSMKYIEIVNSIKYLTGSHSMYDEKLYDESLRPVVSDIKQLNKERLVTYTEIAKADISSQLKADLYEKLIRLHSYHVLDHSFYTDNNKLRNCIENYKRDNFIDRINQSNFNDAIKSMLLTKCKNMSEASRDDWDYIKWKEWMNIVLSLPIGKYHSGSSSEEMDTRKFIAMCSKELNKTVHGLTEPKESILEYLAELRVTPIEGEILCLHGSPGVGKSQLIQSLGRVTGRPIIKIELGGMRDVHNLIGHGFTYVGSQPGIIVRKLINKDCQVADPIIVWEEMDKLSDNSHAIEIQNKLIHIFDPLQNNEFIDEYIGFPIDLSRCFHIISVNNPELLHPVLRDRLEIITVPDPSSTDKIVIVKNFFVPKFDTKFGFKLDIPDDVISYIINKTDEKGVRQLKRHIKKIYRKINLSKFLENSKLGLLLESETINITTDVVDKCIVKTSHTSKPCEHIYI